MSTLVLPSWKSPNLSVEAIEMLHKGCPSTFSLKTPIFRLKYRSIWSTYQPMLHRRCTIPCVIRQYPIWLVEKGEKIEITRPIRLVGYPDWRLANEPPYHLSTSHELRSVIFWPVNFCHGFLRTGTRYWQTDFCIVFLMLSSFSEKYRFFRKWPISWSSADHTNQVQGRS